jgi:hypothetical protein
MHYPTQNLNEGVPLEHPIPPFLRTLCILSFIGCGLMLLVGFFNLKNLFFSVDEVLANSNLQILKEAYPESYEKAVSSLAYKDIDAIMGIVSPALSLLGVIYMWKLKIQGFFLYLIAEIIPYVVIGLTTGFDDLYNKGGMMESFQPLIDIILGLIVVFDFTFIILYALNMKYFK